MKLLAGLSLLVFLCWFVWKVARRTYRRVFFKKLVDKHTSNDASASLAALMDAASSGDAIQFGGLANRAPMQEFREFQARADLASLSDLLDEFVRNYPQEARSHYLLGVHFIRKGWAARGVGYLDTVTEAGAQEFSESIAQAERALLQAVELDGEFVDAYEQLLIVYRAKNDRKEAERLFNAAKYKFPKHIGIHHRMVILLTSRWLGSDREALEFAQTHSAADSSGELACLIPLAYFENWIGTDGGPKSTYFKDKLIRVKLIESFKRFCSSDNLSKENSQARLDALQYYACIFNLSEDKKFAKKAFKAMNGQYSEAAWTTWNEPKEKFVKSKWAAGA